MYARIPKLIALLIFFAAALTQASSAQAQWSLSATPANVSRGSTTTVSWTAPGGSSATDWIGLFKVGGGAGLYSYVYTNGATSGSAPFGIPDELGTFEFRYFLNNTNNQVAASNPVTVANSSFTVNVDPDSTVS